MTLTAAAPARRTASAADCALDPVVQVSSSSSTCCPSSGASGSTANLSPDTMRSQIAPGAGANTMDPLIAFIHCASAENGCSPVRPLNDGMVIRSDTGDPTTAATHRSCNEIARYKSQL